MRSTENWVDKPLLLENFISEKILYKQHILCIIKQRVVYTLTCLKSKSIMSFSKQADTKRYVIEIFYKKLPINTSAKKLITLE